MNILYLIDPNSIHDQKWIEPFCIKENNIFVISLGASAASVKKLEEKLRLSFLFNVGYFSLKRIIPSIISILRIRKIIKKFDIQILHIQYAEPNALWTIFRKFLGVPIIITCRGTDVLKTIPEHFISNSLINFFVKRIYKAAFEAADYITVTSEEQRNSVKKFCDSKQPIEIIRTGVDLEKLSKAKNYKLPKGVNEDYILFPRFIKPIYNHEFTIDSLGLLSDTVKKKYQMVFIGKNGGDIEYQNQLLKQVEKYRDINFIFLPTQEQESIHSLIFNSSLIVMNPVSDGSPVSAMEAMALDKIVILGPLNYDADIFSNKNVLKLENWSNIELAQKIEYSLSELKGKYVLDKSTRNLIDRKINMGQLNLIYKGLIK